MHIRDGMTPAMLDWVMELKNVRRGRIRELAEAFDGVDYREGQRPWDIPCDIALPSATQNELDANDAAALVGNGCVAVCEGANMPCTPEAVEILHHNKVGFGPAKAANAGGVATSALENLAQKLLRTASVSLDLDLVSARGIGRGLLSARARGRGVLRQP